jgi:Protein of unknown function (DUF3108)
MGRGEGAAIEVMRRVALLGVLILPALMAGDFLLGEPAAISVFDFHLADAKSASAERAMPFRSGEILNYRLEWAPFSNAAVVRTEVVERRNLYGWGTWHFRATVHSQLPLRNLFEVDDQFDSYTDAATLESHQYEMYLDEMGKKQDDVLHLVAIGQASRGNVAPVIVQPGTRDPLGAFYMLRATDWKRTPEVRAPLYDGSDLYEMRAHLEVPVETVATAMGNFQATRIAIRLFLHGKVVPETSFSVWLERDAARTPVLVLAEMPYGTVRGELIAAPK